MNITKLQSTLASRQFYPQELHTDPWKLEELFVRANKQCEPFHNLAMHIADLREIRVWYLNLPPEFQAQSSLIVARCLCCILSKTRSLSQEKQELMERSRLDRLSYTPALSFFKSKEWMENTTTFKIIRKMPKGDLLSHCYLEDEN